MLVTGQPLDWEAQGGVGRQNQSGSGRNSAGILAGRSCSAGQDPWGFQRTPPGHCRGFEHSVTRSIFPLKLGVLGKVFVRFPVGGFPSRCCVVPVPPGANPAGFPFSPPPPALSAGRAEPLPGDLCQRFAWILPSPLGAPSARGKQQLPRKLSDFLRITRRLIPRGCLGFCEQTTGFPHF